LLNKQDVNSYGTKFGYPQAIDVGKDIIKAERRIMDSDFVLIMRPKKSIRSKSGKNELSLQEEKEQAKRN
jgi:hypothetical protein